MRVCFISDLHLFSRRSSADRYLAAIEHAANRAETVVFGGDMFDFRWTTFANAEATVENAIKWLRDFANRFPRCRIMMLLGNHDHHELLIEQIMDFARLEERFSWEPYVERIGNCVFLHGDVLDGQLDAASLAASREKYHRDHGKQSHTMNVLYDWAISLRVHRLAVQLVHPHRLTAQRLLSYLDSIGQGQESGVRCVVFGHTHRALNDFEWQQVRFFNGGAAIKGLPFRVIEIETDDFT